MPVILATWEAEIRGIIIQSQSEQKLARLYISVIPATWEVEVEAAQFEASPGKSARPKLKAKGLGVWLKW
jgi:hypothetical protein